MIRNAVRLGCLLTLLGWACGAVQAQTVTFDLSDVDTSYSTPFQSTSGPVTATFSSPNDPSGFIVKSSDLYDVFVFDPPFQGYFLSSNVDSAPLVVTFNKPLSSISLDFATLNLENVTLTLFNGGTSGSDPGTTTTQGVLNEYGFYQGLIELGPSTPFDKIELTYVLVNPPQPGDFVDNDIAAANFTVTVAVPEPASVIPWLLGSGSVLGYAALRKRSVRVSH